MEHGIKNDDFPKLCYFTRGGRNNYLSISSKNTSVFFNELIGVRESLQETIDFPIFYLGLSEENVPTNPLIPGLAQLFNRPGTAVKPAVLDLAIYEERYDDSPQTWMGKCTKRHRFDD